jgi:hypothetical protein
MADAHPNRGGTSEGFAIARQRHLNERWGGGLQQRGGGFRNTKDLAKAPQWDARRSAVPRPPTGASAMSWLYRWKPRGLGAKSSRVMGLGPCDCTAANLEGARKRAAEARELVAAGKDPREERDKIREAEAQRLRPRKTFKEYATEFVKQREHEWKNPVHRKQCRDTLGIGGFGKSNMRYCDSLHRLHINKIDRHAICAVLDPIWAEKPETASRLRGRIERILDAAKAEGLREGDNPAAWKGNLDTRYSAKRKLREVKHHAALPWDHVARMSCLGELMHKTLLALVVAALGGCATIVEGTTQSIRVEVVPDNGSCDVMRDGEMIGRSVPGQRDVPVSKSYYDLVFSCSAPGYEPKSENLASALSPYTVASALLFDFGIVDNISGASMRYPTKVTVILQKTSSPSSRRSS